MSTIFIPTSIISILVALSTGYFTERMSHHHRLMVVYCLLASICIGCLYHATEYFHYYAVFSAYILILSAYSALLPTIIVNMYRVFGTNASMILSFCIFIVQTINAVSPQIISASITTFGNYSYALYLFAIYGFCVTILFLIIPSPQPQQEAIIQAEGKDKEAEIKAINDDPFVNFIASPSSFKAGIKKIGSLRSKSHPSLIRELSRTQTRTHLEQLDENEPTTNL